MVVCECGRSHGPWRSPAVYRILLALTWQLIHTVGHNVAPLSASICA